MTFTEFAAKFKLPIAETASGKQFIRCRFGQIWNLDGLPVATIPLSDESLRLHIHAFRAMLPHTLKNFQKARRKRNRAEREERVKQLTTFAEHESDDREL